MTWIQIVRDIETPRLTSKIKDYLTSHLPHVMTMVVGLLLVYTIYTVFTLRTITRVEIKMDDLYLNLLGVATVLACFCIVISRNKLKNNSYIFLYLNTNINGYQTIVGSMFYLFLFYMVIIMLTFFPALLGIIIQDKTIDPLYFPLLIFTLILLFILTVTVWVIVKLLIMKLTSVEKEHLTANTISLLIIMFGILIAAETYLKNFLEQRSLIHFLLVAFLLVITAYALRRTATNFLTQTFRQKNAGTLLKRYETNHLNHSNPYMLQTKVEWLNFFRNQVFKEQGLLLIILVMIMIGTYYTFDSTSFFTLYSFIIQFGLKEILIMLPLTIGIHFKNYKFAIYHLNSGKHSYFVTRVIFIYVVNCFTYFSFLLLTRVWFGVDAGGILSALISIGFITMISILTAFVIKIDDFNKTFVVIFLLVFVNGFDLVIHQVMKEALLLQSAYLGLTLFIFYFIQSMYIRRPIIK
ncbi:hypothetical protein [Halobacillus naozhouensis]|uniref:Uncharacterized protein n=1 Tax=Halobacillus naozhouensis TaxID=554880 RepID=A0ABY8IWF2_9BACI|nr:hypothetical protein [Halobacillus naozhouensis]WFT74071.1 hypothetical protein P9989_17110 [Halobacillus naozhouensis]